MGHYGYGTYGTTWKTTSCLTLRFCQSRNEPFKAGSESSTTRTAFEAPEASLKPTQSAASEDSTKTEKTGTTMAVKKPVRLGKPEKLKPEGTKMAGTSAPPRKPTIGTDKTTKVTETTDGAGMTGMNRPSGTTRTFRTSGKPAPPAKPKNLKTEKSAPLEKPKTDTNETEEIFGRTETTRMNPKPTSSAQSGKGKGKMVETTEGTEASGSSTAIRTTGFTRKGLPFRNSRK